MVKTKTKKKTTAKKKKIMMMKKKTRGNMKMKNRKKMITIRIKENKMKERMLRRSGGE